MSGKNPIPTKDPLVYEGANVIVPIGGWRFVRAKRDPTSNDKKYPVGAMWLNTVAKNVWIQTQPSGVWTELAAGAGNVDSITGTANQIAASSPTGNVTLSLIGPYTPATYTAHGVLVGEGTSSIAATAAGTNGQVLVGSTGADPAFATLTSTTGIGFTGGAASLALNVTGGGFKVNAASTGTTLVAQNSYTVTQAGATSFALPATANPGDMFLIAGAQSNTAGWTVTQGVGQEIWSNTSHSTSGAGGSISGAKSTSVWLICTVANTEFLIIGNTAGITFT